ncbi:MULTISPECIES: hypothetical protein [Brachybacterium]|nr:MULTISPECIES: hypothetical protein [Brachybacterium]
MKGTRAMSKALSGILITILTLVPAGIAIVVTIEAVRTGRVALGGDSVADNIPVDFYGTSSFLPAGVLDNAGWVIAACIVWIIAAALLAGLTVLRRTDARRTR